MIKVKEEFDSIIESLELIADPEFMASYKKAKRKLKTEILVSGTKYNILPTKEFSKTIKKIDETVKSDLHIIGSLNPYTEMGAEVLHFARVRNCRIIPVAPVAIEKFTDRTLNKVKTGNPTSKDFEDFLKDRELREIGFSRRIRDNMETNPDNVYLLLGMNHISGVQKRLREIGIQSELLTKNESSKRRAKRYVKFDILFRETIQEKNMPKLEDRVLELNNIMKTTMKKKSTMGRYSKRPSEFLQKEKIREERIARKRKLVKQKR